MRHQQRRPAPRTVGPAAHLEFGNVHNLNNIHQRVQGSDHYATFRHVSSHRVGNPARLPQTPHPLRRGDVRDRALQRRIFLHSWISQITAMLFRVRDPVSCIRQLCASFAGTVVAHRSSATVGHGRDDLADRETVERCRSVTEAPDQGCRDILPDLAITLALGGACLVGRSTPGAHPEVFGHVAFGPALPPMITTLVPPTPARRSRRSTLPALQPGRPHLRGRRTCSQPGHVHV